MPATLKHDIDPVLSTAVFRANPDFELVLFDRLPAAQQAMLVDLKQQADLYGILRPKEDTPLTLKSVTRETALLFLTLREPGPMPQYALPRDPAQRAGVVRLVLDQILQVQRDGRFVSGAEAYDVFYEPAPAAAAANRLQALSIAAVQYGERLAVSDVFELSARLYNYHRIPISSAWREKYPSGDDVSRQLGVTEHGPHAALLAESWLEAKGDGDDGDDGWRAWVRRRPRPGVHAGADGACKLYISPMPEFIEAAFAAALAALTDSAALQFKVGADLEGLLRPDKMVAYFTNVADLRAAATEIASRLEGCPAHGVPFTADLAEDGLLSWGVDPPASARVLNWQPQESWRLWLTNRLAHALLTARATASAERHGLQPWQYALERVALEGIDTSTWTAINQRFS